TVAVICLFAFLARSALFSLFFIASAAFVLPASSNLSTFPRAWIANAVVEAVGTQASLFCGSAQLASISFPDHVSASASAEATTRNALSRNNLGMFILLAESKLSK